MNVFDKFVISNTEPESTKVLWILRDTDSEGANARAFIDGKWRGIGNDTNLSAYLTIEAYQEYMNQYYKKNETDTKLFGKIDKPEVIGTAGQILSLNAQGKPTWSNPAAGSVMDDTMSDESENPVQNKVIKEYVDDVAETKASKNGYYETLGAGTATNLKGDTVTDNTFIYRQTGGSQNVASGSAQIECIKGNSIAWNQIISNGDFKNGTIHWLLQQGTDAVVSTTDGLEIEAITSTNENSQIGKAIGNNLLVDTHKFYFHFDIKRNEIENKEFIFYIGNGWRQRITVDTFYIDEPNQWVSKTYISTITNSNVNRLVFWYKDATPDIGTRWALNNVIAIDLTRIYGSGNEPTTVEQFEADYFKWFGKPLGYEAYDKGSLIPVKMSGIKTSGFNLYANGSARVIKGNQYYIDGTYTSVTYSDGTAITPSSHLFTVDRNDTLVITGGDNTTIVNLNDAEKNGTYEAHWENEQNLPITQLKGRLDGTGELVTVFPDGLKRAGNVYDEIKVENGVVKAIKRVGSQTVTGAVGDTIALVGCSTTTTTFLSNVEVGTLSGGTITLTNAVTDASIYYELQTPQKYIIEGVDLPMGYKEENGGTEEVLVPAPTEGGITSCAPTLGLRYPYDAKGEIENIKTTLGNADTVPTKNSTDLITSGAVAAHGSALDVSLLNADTTTTPITLATYADLSAALAAIPSAYQSGGMSIKFIQLTPAKYTVVKTEGIVEQPTGTEIQSDPGVNSGTYSANELSAFSSLPATLNSSLTYYLTVTETVDEQEVTTYTTWSITMVQSSDNKYVQYRLMATSWSTNVTDWQGVDDVPTAGSKNLIESGAVQTKTHVYDTVIDSYNSVNLFDKTKIIINKYVDYRNGNLVTQENTNFVTDFIPIDEAGLYINYIATGIYKGVACYNAEGSFTHGAKSVQQAVFQDGDVYARFTGDINHIDETMVIKGTSADMPSEYEPYGYFGLLKDGIVGANNIKNKNIILTKLADEDFDGIPINQSNKIVRSSGIAAKINESTEDLNVCLGQVGTKTKYVNLFDKSKTIDGYKLRSSDGTIYEDSQVCVSDFIPCKPNTPYYSNALVGANRTHGGFCFYSSNYEESFISNVLSNGATAPENAAYLRVEFYINTAPSYGYKNNGMVIEGTSEDYPSEYVPFGVVYKLNVEEVVNKDVFIKDNTYCVNNNGTLHQTANQYVKQISVPSLDTSKVYNFYFGRKSSSRTDFSINNVSDGNIEVLRVALRKNGITKFDNDLGYIYIEDINGLINNTCNGRLDVFKVVNCANNMNSKLSCLTLDVNENAGRENVDVMWNLPNVLVVDATYRFWYNENTIIRDYDVLFKNGHYFNVETDCSSNNRGEGYGNVLCNGTYIKFSVYRKNYNNTDTEISSHTITLDVRAKLANATKNVIFIGDSYTNTKWGKKGLIGYVQEFAEADGNTVISKGIRTVYDETKAEGYNGYAIGDFLAYTPTDQRPADWPNTPSLHGLPKQSPFMFSDDDTAANAKFNFAKYLTDYNIGQVDCIVIFLGINGGGYDTLRNMIQGSDSTYVSSFRAALPNVKIIVVNLPAYFGFKTLSDVVKNNGNNDRINRNNGYIKYLAGGIENVVIAPTNEMDRVYGYRISNTLQEWTQFPNDTEVVGDVEIPKNYSQQDNHPSTSGIKSIAYSIYHCLFASDS